MAAQLAVKGPLTPSLLQRGGECSAAPGSAGSQTIREMAEGFSRVSNPAAPFKLMRGLSAYLS